MDRPCGPDRPDDERRFVVGMALKKDKASKHISQKLIQVAARRGIDIRAIDEACPLETQGPFDVILQKIRRRGTHQCCGTRPRPAIISE